MLRLVSRSPGPSRFGRPIAFVAWVAGASACTLAFPLDELQHGTGAAGVTTSQGPASGATTTQASGMTGNAVSSGAGGSASLYASTVLADQPMAHFRFEDAVGATCHNEVDGSPITCVYPSAEATAGASGADGRSLCFSTNQPTASLFGGLDFPDDVPFTLELWVNVAASMSGASFPLFENMKDPGGQRTGTWLLVGPDDVPFSETWVAGVHYLYTHATTPLPFDTWVQIVLTHSDVDHLFINAAPAPGGFVMEGLKRAATGVPFSLGGFVGCVDEFSAYDHELAADRIAAHFAAGQ